MTFPFPMVSPDVGSPMTIEHGRTAFVPTNTSGPITLTDMFINASEYNLMAVLGRRPGGDLNLSSLTLGGNAPILSFSAKNSNDGCSFLGMYLFAPTGNTQDNAIITWDQVSNRTVATTYKISGLNNHALFFATTSDTDGSSVLDVSLDTKSSGVVAVASYNGVSETTTWFGVAEYVDFSVESSHYYSAAGAAIASGQSPRTITATRTTADTSNAISIAVALR